jgi:hypothetical protein
MQSMKDNSKTKMNNIVQLGCLISKLLRLFVNFLSAIVIIFYRVPIMHYAVAPTTLLLKIGTLLPLE